MRLVTAVLALAAVAFAAPIVVDAPSDLGFPEVEFFFDVLYLVESLEKGGAIARNNQNELFSLAEGGAILDHVTLTQEQAEYMDYFWDDLRELTPFRYINVDFVAPETNDVEERQIQIPPVSRPSANEANTIDNGNSEVLSPKGRSENPNAFNIDKRQSRSRPLANKTRPNAVEGDSPNVPFPKGRLNTRYLNEVPPRVHPFNTPFVSPTPFTTGNKKFNPTEVNTTTQDLEPLPEHLDIKPPPAGLKTLHELGIRKGGKMIRRSHNGTKDECRPLKYCVDSSGCSGGCDACTYVGWFPYGQCMSRENNVGRIVD